MKHLALFVAGWFAIISPAFAETFIWDCNKEADMKEYRCKPGYMPYTYPHPLIAQTEGSPSNAIGKGSKGLAGML